MATIFPFTSQSEAQMLFSDGHVNVFQVKGQINTQPALEENGRHVTPVVSSPCGAASFRCFGRGLSKREETYTVLEQQHSGRVFTLRADLRPGRHRENGRRRYAFATRSQTTKLAA